MLNHSVILGSSFFFLWQNSNCISPNYMGQQFDINEKMRAILIDWLIEVQKKKMQETMDFDLEFLSF